MSALNLQIIGKNLSNWISDGQRIVAGPYTSHDNAVTALRGVEARLRPVLIRKCMACPDHFKSTGKGHRLCPSCTKDA